jgi:hypothetical protein
MEARKFRLTEPPRPLSSRQLPANCQYRRSSRYCRIDYEPEVAWSPQARLQRAALAAVFGLVAVLVDLKVPFPADMNAAFPESLAFYPVMGFGVEILFHVVPLAVLLPILTSVFKGMGQDTAIWIAIGLVALLEPAFQTVTGRPAGSVPLWATAVVALNIFLINLTQLVLFKRFDFVTMYAFRLAYYAIWHVAWGHFRLGILF